MVVFQNGIGDDTIVLVSSLICIEWDNIKEISEFLELQIVTCFLSSACCCRFIGAD